ncbi:hypothetical protein BC832DRAFT_250962 [Gaertneriomyces semiglobifer]|nr:hypothetical protein BC832DRAFT_250962 [Gaertneriomyces semiglobifer]
MLNKQSVLTIPLLLAGLAHAQNQGEVVVVRPVISEEQQRFNMIVRSILLGVFLLATIFFVVIWTRRVKARKAQEAQMLAMGIPLGQPAYYPPPQYFAPHQVGPQGPVPNNYQRSQDPKLAGDTPTFTAPQPSYAGDTIPRR